MKKKPVDQALALLRKSTGQLSAVRRALEQSMDAPGGLEWEHQIAEPEPEAPAEPEPPKTAALREREKRWRAEFALNWLRRRRKRGR